MLLSGRRCSLTSLAVTPAKAGVEGISAALLHLYPTSRLSYIDADASNTATSEDSPSPTHSHFPPSAASAPPSARKRRSMEYLPHPPNAFNNTSRSRHRLIIVHWPNNSRVLARPPP